MFYWKLHCSWKSPNHSYGMLVWGNNSNQGGQNLVSIDKSVIRFWKLCTFVILPKPVLKISEKLIWSSLHNNYFKSTNMFGQVALFVRTEKWKKYSWCSTNFQKLGVSTFFFYRKRKPIIQQGCIELIKSDSKGVYFVTKKRKTILIKCSFLHFLFIKES